MIGGHGLNGVGFIKDDCVVFRQNTGIVAPQRKIRKEQRVIHNEQIRIPDASSRRVVETVRVVGTFLAQTIAMIA